MLLSIFISVSDPGSGSALGWKAGSGSVPKSFGSETLGVVKIEKVPPKGHLVPKHSPTRFLKSYFRPTIRVYKMQLKNFSVYTTTTEKNVE